MEDRIKFLPNQQKKYIDKLYLKTGMNTIQLARIAGVHPRSFRDWRNEKSAMKFKTAEFFLTEFGIDLPEDKKILINRWKESKNEANRKGGINRFKMYGEFATSDGRKKGGINSWLKREANPYLRMRFVKVIKRPEESDRLAELIGIILGDGGLSHFQCFIYLNSETDREYALFVKDLIAELFGIMPTINKHKKYKLLRVSVSSVDMIEYLLQKGMHLGNKVQMQVGIPDWIWEKSEYIQACIRGLIDTDGCFTIHKYRVKNKVYNYPKIAFTNSSIPILDFVYEGLKKFGFNPYRYLNKKVWLYNHNEVRKYLDIIGTKNYKPSIIKILEGGPDGKAAVC